MRFWRMQTRWSPQPVWSVNEAHLLLLSWHTNYSTHTDSSNLSRSATLSTFCSSLQMSQVCWLSLFFYIHVWTEVCNSRLRARYKLVIVGIAPVLKTEQDRCLWQVVPLGDSSAVQDNFATKVACGADTLADHLTALVLGGRRSAPVHWSVQ